MRGQELAEDQIVTALNEEGEDDTARHVLDWPLWAAFEQRNLLASLLEQYRCLNDLYGLPEQAAEFRAFAETRFGGLRLAPFALRAMRRTREESERAVSRAVQLVKERPELVTWNNWIYLPTPSVFGPAPAGVPPAGRWFAPLLPFGTAFDYNSRLWGGPEAVRRDLALLESIRGHVFHALIRKVLAEARWGKNPPVSGLKALYGPIVAFDVDAMTSIAEAAEKTDPGEFKAAARALCELSIDMCGWLASYLKDHGEPEEAEVFPSGRRPVGQEGFGRETPKGAAIRFPGTESDDAGFKVGDVVVGVDGIRVESLNQLRVQRRTSKDPETDVTCWRAGVIARMRVSREVLGAQGFLE